MLIPRIKTVLAEAGVPAEALRGLPREADLFREGLLDSILLPRVVCALERAFGAEILLGDFERWNFASLSAMAALVERRGGR